MYWKKIYSNSQIKLLKIAIFRFIALIHRDKFSKIFNLKKNEDISNKHS